MTKDEICKIMGSGCGDYIYLVPMRKIDLPLKAISTLRYFFDTDNVDGFLEDVKLMHLRRKVDLRIEPHSFARSDFVETNPFIKEIITTGKRII